PIKMNYLHKYLSLKCVKKMLLFSSKFKLYLADMINNRAIKILRTFTKVELKNFGRFVRSPFHNNNKNISKLFFCLKSRYPEYNTSHEQIYRRLFPGKKYNDDALRHLFSGLNKLCEEFLAYNLLNSVNFTRKLYVLKKLKEKKLDNFFLLTAKKLGAELSNTKIDYDHYRNKEELEKEIIEFLVLRNKQNKIAHNVTKRGESLIASLLALIENQINDINVQRHLYSRLKEENVFDAFINNVDLTGFSKWLSENMTERFVYIAIYCNLILILQK